MNPPTNVLLTDLYQLTMVQAYLEQRMEELAVFEFFVRKLPPHRNFLLAAGLEQVLTFLSELRVTSGADVLTEARAVEGESSYVGQLEHLVAVLADGSPSLLDADRAVGTMKVVDDIYRAAGLEPRPSIAYV